MVRFKNRWILAEFIPVVHGSAQLGKRAAQANIDGKTIWAALKQSVLDNFGDTGWGAVGLSLTGESSVVPRNLKLIFFLLLVKYFSPTTNLCIIRVARDHHNMAWAAVTLLTAIEGVRYIPNVIHLSGTIKHAQLAAISHNREVIARYRALAKSPVAYQDGFDSFLETSELEIEAMQD
ncbi:hypothetical protein HYPSUDRAFT_199957 [Hypholoma sublateritium FD-334 SS-4]|uniref:Ribonuclease P/MRP protein subunit POP5 n=1 Tax=Hypholoma sublateritium (strain FD-334 SS-4) TaxID=945553 RepID=A0A0D2LCM7_HYPSF|nr:hypothetical protein HYPSUDRAFT_199957 [Hypholoma sublateritium FD-334 SS-4]